MKLSYVINRLRDASLQNVADDFLEDIGRTYHINLSLVHIYSLLNSTGNRYFSNYEETINAVDTVNGDNERTLSFAPSRFWEVKDSGGNILVKKNVSNNITTADYVEDNGDSYVQSGEKKIKTSARFASITVIYARFPIRHDYNELNTELDLPDQLLGVMEFFILRRLFPVHLEQGASLANNYLSQANESLQSYSDNIGLGNIQRGFIN